MYEFCLVCFSKYQIPENTENTFIKSTGKTAQIYPCGSKRFVALDFNDVCVYAD